MEITGKNILICPLDWGLGHASRDIPLIQELLDNGNNVTIAADRGPYYLLKEEFPNLEMIRFPSFEISYPKILSFTIGMALQIPKILRWKRREHKMLDKLLDDRDIDIVISDNRYGLWNKKTESIIISHQLSPNIPAGIKWLEKIVHKRIAKWINHFDSCWVPDTEKHELAGILSGNPRIKVPVEYLGPLSRFSLEKNQRQKKPSKRYEILVILSGPEPARTELEKLLIRILRNTDKSTLIVRGAPWQQQGQQVYGNINLVSHLPSYLLYAYIQQAEYIISRSGYSTIMDLKVLGKTAILIPTPGQTEQEYLAEYHSRNAGFKSLKQDEPDELLPLISSMQKR